MSYTKEYHLETQHLNHFDSFWFISIRSAANGLDVLLVEIVWDRQIAVQMLSSGGTTSQNLQKARVDACCIHSQRLWQYTDVESWSRVLSEDLGKPRPSSTNSSPSWWIQWTASFDHFDRVIISKIIDFPASQPWFIHQPEASNWAKKSARFFLLVSMFSARFLGPQKKALEVTRVQHRHTCCQTKTHIAHVFFQRSHLFLVHSRL